MMLAIGLNILVGFAGQLAFANAAMFGIGAYGTGLLQVQLGWSFWLAAPERRPARDGHRHAARVARAAAQRASISRSSTLAFAQATQWVLLHWEAVTFGAGGFQTPPLTSAGSPVDRRSGSIT